MSVMVREADEIFAEARGGRPFTGDTWEAVQPFFERRPFLSRLAEDDRIYNIGVDLLGPDFILEVTEGNLQNGDTPWHGPIANNGAPPHVKISFYPEPLTRDTGCLRVVPGSHLAGSPRSARSSEGPERWSRLQAVWTGPRGCAELRHRVAGGRRGRFHGTRASRVVRGQARTSPACHQFHGCPQERGGDRLHSAAV